jgi:hypothetical protein
MSQGYAMPQSNPHREIKIGGKIEGDIDQPLLLVDIGV